MKRYALIALLIVSVMSTGLRGETIYLNDGSEIVGQITGQDRESITVQTRHTSLRILKQNVKRIAYKSRGSEKVIVQPQQEWANIYLFNGQRISGFIVYRDETMLRIAVNDQVIDLNKRDISAIDYNKEGKAFTGPAPQPASIVIGPLLKTIGSFKGIVNAIRFSSDGRFFAVGTEVGELSVHDAATFARVAAAMTPNGTAVTSLAFGSGAVTLLAGCGDFVIRVYAIKGTALEETSALRGHGNSITDIALTRNSQYLASASLDLTMRIWHLSSGRTVATLGNYDGNALRLALISNDTVLVSGHERGRVMFWSLPGGARMRQYPGHSDRVSAISVRSDGKFFATSGWDNAVKLWSVARGLPFAELKSHTDRVISVAFAGEQNLISGSFDTTIELYSVSDAIRQFAVTGPADQVVEVTVSGKIPDAHHYVSALAVSPDVRILVAGGSRSEVKIWKLDPRR